jgi:hypothetical protein
MFSIPACNKVGKETLTVAPEHNGSTWGISQMRSRKNAGPWDQFEPFPLLNFCDVAFRQISTSEKGSVRCAPFAPVRSTAPKSRILALAILKGIGPGNLTELFPSFGQIRLDRALSY